MSIMPHSNHATLMDNVYRGQRHIYDLTRKYYLLGRDRLIEALDAPYGGTVLEVGCGTGRNLIKIAQARPDCRVYGLDISTEMLKSASASLKHCHCANRIRIAQGDATTFNPQASFGRAKFDRIVFSYTLSMIPEWQAALRWALTLLAPQGSVHIVDFGMQERMPAAMRSMLSLWLRQFHVTPRAELADYCTALAQTLRQDIKVESLYRDYSRMIVIG